MLKVLLIFVSYPKKSKSYFDFLKKKYYPIV